MRNGLISVDAYKQSRAFYIYERKLRYCIEVFFRVRKRASGNASMEKVLCVSVLVKFPRAETRAFLPQWKAGLRQQSAAFWLAELIKFTGRKTVSHQCTPLFFLFCPFGFWVISKKRFNASLWMFCQRSAMSLGETVCFSTSGEGMVWPTTPDFFQISRCFCVSKHKKLFFYSYTFLFLNLSLHCPCHSSVFWFLDDKTIMHEWIII